MSRSSQVGRPSGDESLHRLRAATARRGLTLLSTAWQGTRGSYDVQCPRGHRFTRQAKALLTGTARCAVCVRETLTQRLVEALRQHGFVCHEPGFMGLYTHHRFACLQGHTWTTQADKILRGSGCPQCARRNVAARQRRPDGLARLRRAAAAQGGVCLESTYQGRRERYRFRCAHGHHWTTAGYIVLQGRWCPQCGTARSVAVRQKPEGLLQLKASAVERGGQCLDDDYRGIEARYRFECARGHRWEAVGGRVLRGSWCGRCVSLGRRRTIEDMQQVAASRGGRCLSDAYHDNRTKLIWQCHHGHVWQAAAVEVANHGTWCPNCARLRVTQDPTRRQRYDARG